MNPTPEDAVLAALREWMRNERRLGIAHVAANLPRGPSTAVTGRAAVARPAPPPVEGRGTIQHPISARPTPVPANGATARPRLTGSGAGELPPLCAGELDLATAQKNLAALDVEFVKGCTRCGLHAGRNNTVFGVGHARPDIVFVGEGPGADEDAQGVPFVGRAGQLLTKMIAAMTLARDQVYICNVVKCRPPGNRTPAPEEMDACSPYLFRQLAILRPKVIVTLGAPAGQTLLATKTPIGRLRGRFHEFPPPPLAALGLPACPLMPTFHPAYLLRSPDEKSKTWDDLKQVMRMLGLPIPGET